MADKKGKYKKHIDRDQTKTLETGSKTPNVSDAFLDELKWAFTRFDKLPETKRVELYGNQEYLEQFWEYFKKEYPNILDKIDKKDLPIYIQTLQDKWFKLHHLLDDDVKLHNEFKAEDTEQHVMEHSLSQLKDFCEDKNNNIPDGTFKKFADAAWFTHDTLLIDSAGKLKNIDDLYLVWKKFIEKEDISLGKTSAEHAERMLTPNYNPTERIMVTVALSKLRKELKGSLKTAFDEQFPLPVDIFSSYKDLLGFKNEWSQFIADHASEIDESLAKKFDKVIVTNGDIYKELLKSWKKIDDTKWFSDQEQYFRRIFNKLATRQLFEEVKKTQESIDHYVDAMSTTFKEFPPYINEILKIYPFNDKVISTIDPKFHADLEHIDLQILDVQNAYSAGADAERKLLRAKIKKLKQEREQRRWQAYIAFLKTKEPVLADIFVQLVANTFDFSVLSSEQQQILVDTLVKHKLEDTIKNKVPDLLDVPQEELTQFVHDLFDLKKKDIVIPTRTGPIPLSFTKKEFMSGVYKDLPALNDLENIKNLPLDFVTQLTESNAAFFEDSPIFDSLYTDFAAKNSKFRFNDSYKVRIKKDGKIVEWYLSAYCPIDEKYNDTDYDWWELFLYSEPITSLNQERKYITREWTDGGTPVVIKQEDQSQCDMEILDKKIHLNGDAFWALLFGYVLGQQSMVQKLSPKKEQELAEKFGKLGNLDVYKDKAEEEEELAEPVSEADESKIEKSEKDKFIDERKQLKWYWFPEPQYSWNAGFVKWTRLYIPFADSEVPPTQVSGKAWMYMEITDVDEKKWTFTTKIHGGELRLWKYEWVKKEFSMNAKSLAHIKSIFWDTIYKFPDNAKYSMEQQMAIVNTSAAADLTTYSSALKWENNEFKFALGDEKGEKVTHFGRYEEGIGEAYDQEPGTSVLYNIKYNNNHTVTLTGEMSNSEERVRYPSRDMDYATFLIFIKEKNLQAKTDKQAERMKKHTSGDDKETPTTVHGFSINNILGFFKNGISKINDSIKKYDEERTEDLTDLLTKNGQLYGKIGSFLSPFSRVASSFETMGAEYFLERDNRLWKKVEKRKKFYEDADFSLIYGKYIEPMLKWEITIKPHYKAAAMLLAMIAKGKWPYNRNPAFAGKWMWINILMWPEHQARYLDMRAKKVRELEQGASVYGSIWADNKKNEIVELEMRYMVHTMDARQLGIQDKDKTKYFFYGKYSKTFIDELEKWYTGFFSQNVVDEWYGKNKDAPFEFARWEYFRMIWDRPQQAIPFLKVMATKATNDSQWRTFEIAVMAAMLWWVFLNNTYSDTQSFIQQICRTRWFLPWIWVKNIHQQTKLQRIIDIFSNNDFSEFTKYNASNYSFMNYNDPRWFLWWNQNAAEWWKFQQRLYKGDNLTKLSNFLKHEWTDISGKQTLLQIYSDPKTSLSDKSLIKEFLANGNEKDESLDSDVSNNPYALTWSILTKSQSAVHKMLKVDQNGFAWKNGDEIQTMKWFFTDMSAAIPKHKVDSKEQIKFFMDKFFNRFDEKWFSWNNVTMFIKRLKWCQKNSWKKEIDDILYYSVVGQIIDSMGRGTIPIELEHALLAWRDFFKNNLDAILQPDVLVDSFWWTSYKQDYDKYEPKLEPREWCINLLDRDLKQTSFLGLSPDQRKQMNQKYQYLKADKNYLNFPLYELADKIERNFGIWNRFKNDVNIDIPTVWKKQDTSTSSTPTWARIKNTQVTDKVRRILEGKLPEEITPEEDSLLWYDDFYEYPTTI